MTAVPSANAVPAPRRESVRVVRHRRAHAARWVRDAGVVACSFLVLGLALNVATVQAGEQPAEALVLLNRIQQAAQRQTYVGTFIHQQGTQVQSTRVTHVADHSGEHEKLELMDGQPREFIRHNDDVRCYMADSKLILVEKRARYDSFPALLTSPPVELDRYYKLSFDGVDRIAGHAAQRVSLEARDQQRYGYRLWFDKESFLLLKAQTLNEKGGVIEQVAFTDVVIGGTVDASRLKPSVTNTTGWRTETSRMVTVDLAQDGWSVAQPVSGFRKVMEVRRAFGGREDIGQMVFSDGLAVISVFIEPAAPHDAPAGEASKGPVNVVTERHGDFWLTIVGDAPASSVRDMARQIDFRASK